MNVQLMTLSVPPPQIVTMLGKGTRPRTGGPDLNVPFRYLYFGITLAPSVSGSPSGLNLVVAAVLRDSVCVVSLLPCVADCIKLYTVCKVERFVLTIIKRRLLLLFIQLLASSVQYSNF